VFHSSSHATCPRLNIFPLRSQSHIGHQVRFVLLRQLARIDAALQDYAPQTREQIKSFRRGSLLKGLTLNSKREYSIKLCSSKTLAYTRDTACGDVEYA
jgi:hypothetical protein